MKNTILFLLISIVLFSCTGTYNADDPVDEPITDSSYNEPPQIDGLKLGARLPGTFFISPDGNDANPGTFAKPKFQLKKLWPLQSGDTVWCLGGSYLYTLSQYLGGSNGTAAKRIFIGAFPGHKPVFTKASTYPESQQDLIYFEGNYFHFKGIEIANFSQNKGGYHWPAFRTPGMTGCLFENISYHDNGAGFSVRGNSTGNEFLNCDFYNNADPYSSPAYENADGIDLHYVNAGCVNTLRGCRAYWNADDGFDLWENNGNVIFENCWSFYNGYQAGTFKIAGNGTGFKLGRTANNSSKQLRTVKNCIAYKNQKFGIIKNEANCLILVQNCTAVENGEYGLWSGSWNTTPTTYKNNISYKEADRIGSFDIKSNNSWQGVKVVDADFESWDADQLLAPRNVDGSLPTLTFLKPLTGTPIDGLGYQQGVVITPPPPPDDPPVSTVEQVIHYYTDKTAFVTNKTRKTLKFDIEVMTDGTVRKKK